MSDAKPRRGSTPLVRNIAFNTAARGVLVVLSIAVTPVLVHRLGTEQYGIYALATVLGSGLTNVFALGLIPGIVAMLSRSVAQGNDPETQRVIGTSMTLFTLIGIAGGVGLALAVPYLVHTLLRIPTGLQGTAATALWISAVGLGLNLVFAVFNAIPYALQRYDIIASRIVGLALLSVVATVAYVLVYANLAGVMVIQVTAGVLGLLVYYQVSRRQLHFVRFLPSFDWPTFVKLARFTAFKSLGDVALTFGSRFDQFAVGSLIGVGAVGIYAIPSTACQRILQLLGEVAAPMFPRMSSVETDEKRRAVLISGTRLVALPAALIAVTLIVLAEPILRTWIGGHQGVVVATQGRDALRLLAAAMFLQAVVVVAGLYCEAIQRPSVNNSFTVLGAVVQIPVILVLIPRLGITGAALGVLVASVVQTVPFLFIMTDRVAHMSIGHLLRDGLAGPIGSSVVAGLIGLALLAHTATLPWLALVIIVMATGYLAAAVASGALRAGDLDQLQSIVPLPLKSVPGYHRLNSWMRP